MAESKVKENLGKSGIFGILFLNALALAASSLAMHFITKGQGTEPGPGPDIKVPTGHNGEKNVNDKEKETLDNEGFEHYTYGTALDSTFGNEMYYNVEHRSEASGDKMYLNLSTTVEISNDGSEHGDSILKNIDYSMEITPEQAEAIYADQQKIVDVVLDNMNELKAAPTTTPVSEKEANAVGESLQENEEIQQSLRDVDYETVTPINDANHRTTASKMYQENVEGQTYICYKTTCRDAYGKKMVAVYESENPISNVKEVKELKTQLESGNLEAFQLNVDSSVVLTEEMNEQILTYGAGTIKTELVQHPNGDQEYVNTFVSYAPNKTQQRGR